VTKKISTDTMSPELLAMHGIALLLDGLANREARERVVRWISESYASNAKPNDTHVKTLFEGPSERD